MAGTSPETPRGPFTLAFSLGSIPVAIEPSFWLVTVLFGWSSGLEAALAWTGVVLISVMLHELGHALTAMAFGSRARIRLYSFGGLTYHERLGQRASILTSLAGPFAGFLLGGAILAIRHFAEIENDRLFWLLRQFEWVTLGWGAINLVPVLPLDGGHVMAEALGPRRTRLAVMVSVAVASAICVGSLTMAKLHPDVQIASFTLARESWQFFAFLFGFLAFRSGVALGQLSRGVQPPAGPGPGAAKPQAGDPEDVALARGWQALSLGDDAEAERMGREVLNGAASQQARNRALDLLAWVALARSDSGQALRLLERTVPPEQIRSLTQALALEAAGRGDRALTPALAAYAAEPSEASAQLAVRLLTAAGKYDEAEAVAEAFHWPKAGLKEAALGAVRHARGDYPVAAKLLQLAFELRKRPTDAFNAACSLARGGDAGGALSWLERSVEAGLDDPTLLETDPDLEPARKLPGFSELLERARRRALPGT